MSPHFNLFLREMDGEFSVSKTKRTIHTFISDKGKSKCLSWYGGAAEQTAWVTAICAKVLLTWRHILGFYRDILPSRWCISWEVHGYYIKTMTGIILHVLQWFLDRVNVLDWAADLSPIEKVWLIMKKRTDNNNNRQLNIWSMKQDCMKQDCTKIVLAEY